MTREEHTLRGVTAQASPLEPRPATSALAAPAPPALPAIVVDLDHTLVRTDTLVESLVKLATTRPIQFLKCIWALRLGRAAMKQRVARLVVPDARLLPYEESLVAHMRTARASGRPCILATAADRRIATAVAEHLGLFDAILASDGSMNLKGRSKLDAIRRLVGDDFVYAGDSSADLTIWRAARAAILVDAGPRLGSAVEAVVPIEALFPRTGTLRAAFAALRPHQWFKNSLVFVPLFTSFSLADGQRALHALLAAVALSLLASGTYIINDILDIEHDRAHPRKRNRPFASGSLTIADGLNLACILFVAAFATAGPLGMRSISTLLVYLAGTLCYSLFLKRKLLADTLALAGLYTIRLVAGSVATGIPLSRWLMAFSFFVFFALALLKRASELMSSGATSPRGRGYDPSDVQVVTALGTAATAASIVVFGLYASAPETIARFRTPHLLWVTAGALLYWQARLWVLTSRGLMQDDPVVFTLRDRTSRRALGLALAIVMLARAVPLPLSFLE